MTTKAKRPPAPLKPAAQPVRADVRPAAVRYRSRLETFTVERLKDGWWIVSDAVKKQGPFATAQDVCIAIARELCAELSNRHQSLASFHGLKPGDPLYGLPASPQLYEPRTEH